MLRLDKMRWDGKMKGIFFFPCVIWYFCLSVCTSYFNSSFNKKKEMKKKHICYQPKPLFTNRLNRQTCAFYRRRLNWKIYSRVHLFYYLYSTLYIYLERSFNSLKIEWIQKIYIFELLLWILYQKRYFKGPFVHHARVYNISKYF